MTPSPSRSFTGGLPVLAATALAVIAVELALPWLLGRTVDAVIGHHAPGTWLIWSAVAVAILVVAEPLRDFVSGAVTARRTASTRRRLIRRLLAPGTTVHITTANDTPVDGTTTNGTPVDGTTTNGTTTSGTTTSDTNTSGTNSTNGGTTTESGTGDLVTRVVSNAADAGTLGVAKVLAVIATVPTVGALIALAWIDGWLVVGFLAGTALVTLMLRRYVQDASDAGVRYARTQAQIAALLSDALAGIRTVSASGTADREVERCLRPLPALGTAGAATWRILARSSAQSALVGPLLQLSVVAAGGWELSRGTITPGELVAAIQYAALGAGLGGVVAALNRVARARAGVRRVDEILTRPTSTYGTDRLPPGPGALTFSGVTALVDGVPAIADVDLAVPGGASVAVVGRSGSGKSLLAALAGGLVTPDLGEVLLDGVPLRRLSAGTLRREIGVAFERPALIGATIAEAVGLAHEQADRALVATAVRQTRAETYVSRLPAGLDTPLDAAPMSGGEAQRLGLARAWGAGRLLVLDDATSSLDTATEAQITGLLTESDRRTHMIVAHRASTAARCRFVVWLDGGRVRAVADHATLWSDPRYRAVFGADVSQP